MYEYAKKAYAAYGVDTEAALAKLKDIPVSIHCWQGDDVVGLDGGGAASGGIQTTGNYPGRARNFEELKADIKKSFALIPGKKRLNLHASYAVINGEKVDRDEYRPEHFAPWVQFAKEIGLDGLDFNPTMFSHVNMKDGLSLSSPDEKIRKFWVKHCIACLKNRRIFRNRNAQPLFGQHLDPRRLQGRSGRPTVAASALEKEFGRNFGVRL
jgi:L-rhamnose isomerase